MVNDAQQWYKTIPLALVILAIGVYLQNTRQLLSVTDTRQWTVYALQFASIHIQPTINATFTYFLLCTPHRLCFPLAVARDSISPRVSPFLSNLSYLDTILSKHTVTYPCSEMTRKQSPSVYSTCIDPISDIRYYNYLLLIMRLDLCP